MEISVREALRRPGEMIPFHLAFDLEPMTVHEDPVSFPAQLVLDGFSMGLEEDEETVLLSGTLTYRWESICARCAEKAEGESTVEFQEEFGRVKDDKYPDRYLFMGETLQLDDLVSDQILMDLPIRFLCREDCQGLCPVCGCNLNREQCDCDRSGGSSPFDVLKNLHLDDE